MKKNIFILILFIAGFKVSAQIINNVPALFASKLDNGWYKYQSEGATFDNTIYTSNLLNKMCLCAIFRYKT